MERTETKRNVGHPWDGRPGFDHMLIEATDAERLARLVVEAEAQHWHVWINGKASGSALHSAILFQPCDANTHWEDSPEAPHPGVVRTEPEVVQTTLHPELSNAGARLVVVDAYATGCGTDSAYCTFYASQELLQRITTFVALCETHRLTEIRYAESPQLWGRRGLEEDLRLESNELVVLPSGQFWFTVTPRHDYYVFETKAMSVDCVVSALAESDGSVVFLNKEAREIYDEDHEQEATSTT